MNTTTLNRFGALNSAAKNPLKNDIESIAIGVAKIRSLTDNLLMRGHITELSDVLRSIDNEIWIWVDLIMEGK